MRTVLVCLLLLSACKKYDTDVPMEPVTHPGLGVTVGVPLGWSFERDPNGDPVQKGGGIAVRMLRRLPGHVGPLPRADLLVSPVAEGISLEQFLATTLGDMAGLESAGVIKLFASRPPERLVVSGTPVYRVGWIYDLLPPPNAPKMPNGEPAKPARMVQRGLIALSPPHGLALNVTLLEADLAAFEKDMDGILTILKVGQGS